MNIKELKKIRNRFNLKRQDLAEKLNISLETLNTWEYRDKEIPEDKIEFVRSVFSMYFVSEDNKQKEPDFAELPIDEKLNKMYSYLEKVNERMNSLEFKLKVLSSYTPKAFHILFENFDLEELNYEDVEKDVIANSN